MRPRRKISKLASPTLAQPETKRSSVPANFAASLASNSAPRTLAIWFTRCGASNPNRNSSSPSRATPASTAALNAAIVKEGLTQYASARVMNAEALEYPARIVAQVMNLGEFNAHTLRAEMNGAEMKVFADGSLVWQGSVGVEALGFEGPVGIRSDNAHLQIELRTGQPLQAKAGAGCRSSEEESE